MSRDCALSTLATCRSTSSPTWWPCVSLNFLKKSMSSSTSVQGVPLRCHSLSRRLSSSSKARRFDKAGERIGAGFGLVCLDFGGLRGELLFGLFEPLLQLGVGGEHLIHRGEHGRVGAVGFAIDAGQVGGDRLHLGGVVADVAGDVLGQVGDAAGGHGGPLGRAFRSLQLALRPASWPASFAAGLAIFAPKNQTPAAKPTPSATHAQSRFTSRNVPMAAGNSKHRYVLKDPVADWQLTYRQRNGCKPCSAQFRSVNSFALEYSRKLRFCGLQVN